MKKIVLLVCIMALLLSGCIVYITPAEETTEPTTTEAEETVGVIQTLPKTKELVFVEAKMVELDDEQLIGLFFDYTNISGENRMPCDDYDVVAFQNGIELNILVYTGDVIDGAIQCDTEVKSGTTARTIWTFEPKDESPVIVECSDGQIFTLEIEKELTSETEATTAVATEPEQKILNFLDDFGEYGYTEEQIEDMRTLLVNVGITEITELEITPVSYGMQDVKGILYKDTSFGSGGKEVQVHFNIENGAIYIVSIYCPSYQTANQTPYLSGLTDRRADLYCDYEGGYLKKIDWENKAVIDY